jgi:hypothetical protein
MAIIAENFLPMSGSERGTMYPLTQPGGFAPDSGGLSEGAVSALSELFDLYVEDSVSDADVEKARLILEEKARLDAAAAGFESSGVNTIDNTSSVFESASELTGESQESDSFLQKKVKTFYKIIWPSGK